jgi:hypothetical protein
MPLLRQCVTECRDCLSGALLLRQHIASQLSSVSFTEDGGGLLAAGPKGILKVCATLLTSAHHFNCQTGQLSH